MSRSRIVFGLIAMVSGVLLLAASQESSSPSAQKEVTYSRDVAPILYKNCITCHRPNDIAPMSLITYKDTRPWAKLIRDAVVERKMPPWHADPNIGDFLNNPRLAKFERP
jgi:hypothetical protein